MPRPETKPLELRIRAVELYTSGSSLRQVAAVIGVASSTVQRWLHLAKIKLRNRSAAGTLRFPQKSTHWRTARNNSRRKMERYLGIKLEYNQIVHHKDEDYTNGELDNLQVVSRKEHSKLHSIHRPRDPETKRWLSSQ